MKRTIICAALSFGLAAMPMSAFARDHYRQGGGHGGYHQSNYSHGGYYRGGGHYRHHGGADFGVVLPLIAGIAVIGAVADAFAGPRYVAPAGPTYYASPPTYQYEQPAYGYAPAPAPYGYAPPPVYGYTPPVCTIYPNGATYCR